jgi:hypothetical protein
VDKTRVYNQRKYSIGLALQNGLEYTIKPGSFALLTRDEIEYLASIAPTLFEGEKQLRLEDRALATQLGFVEGAQVESLDAEAIRKHLSQRAPQVKAWLDGIREPYLLDAICDVAAEMDLPASKLQLLKERMPNREFIREE